MKTYAPILCVVVIATACGDDSKHTAADGGNLNDYSQAGAPSTNDLFEQAAPWTKDVAYRKNKRDFLSFF